MDVVQRQAETKALNLPRIRIWTVLVARLSYASERVRAMSHLRSFARNLRHAAAKKAWNGPKKNVLAPHAHKTGLQKQSRQRYRAPPTSSHRSHAASCVGPFSSSIHCSSARQAHMLRKCLMRMEGLYILSLQMLLCALTPPSLN